MKVLVTGGAGFIGSHVVDGLVDAGHDVCVFDRRAPTCPSPEARYVQGDLRDANACEKALEGVEAVSHQASRVGLGVDFDDVTGYVMDNDLGTGVLLQTLHSSGFTGRIVLASSMTVYGEGAFRCDDCGPVRPSPRSEERMTAGRFEHPCPGCGKDLLPQPVTEEARLDPRNVYAATKAHQEQLCFAYERESGSSVIALRYHNVYGPRAPLNTPYAGVASLFLSALRRGEPAYLFEDGGQLRDFVHVRDVAAANLVALSAPTTISGPFNIASGRPRSVRELAESLYRASSYRAPPPLTTGRWRLGDVRHVFASPELAALVLGFRATVPFDDGLRELAETELVASSPNC